jgi:hypothetical protein
LIAARGYFGGLSAGLFKTDSQGRELFFPRGKFGTGGIVQTSDDGPWVRRYLKFYSIALLIGIVPIGMMSDESSSRDGSLR